MLAATSSPRSSGGWRIGVWLGEEFAPGRKGFAMHREVLLAGSSTEKWVGLP